MNNLEKYLDQVIEQKPIEYDSPAEIQEPQPTTNLLASIRRRWYIVFVVTLLICAIGLPAIWFLVEPVYVVTGTLRVLPAVRDVLTGEAQSSDVASYLQLANTEAYSIMNDASTLGRIVDDLAPRHLAYFKGGPRSRLESLLARFIPTDSNSVPPEQILRKAMADGEITARPLRDTVLLAVMMRHSNRDEAQTIVNSFLRNHVIQYKLNRDYINGEDLRELDRHQKTLSDQVKDARASILALVGELGTTELDPLVLEERNRSNFLRAELTRLETQKIKLDADIAVFEGQDPNSAVSPEQIVASRVEYINADPMVKELSANIVQMERDLITVQQRLTTANPISGQREAMLNAFKQKLEETRQTLGEEFDSSWDRKLKEAAQQRVLHAKNQKAQVEAYIAQIQRALPEQEAIARKMGDTNLDIQEREFRLKLDNDMLDQATRRLRQLEMERDRRPQVEVRQLAEVSGREDRRPKAAAATVFVALACGVGLAFLRDKMDKRLQTPEDVTRQLDLPILGTTTSSRTVKPALFAEQIAGDYQTIRTNLGLLYNGGMPKSLVVSSPGTREGKTTFAVNLATSLAKAGKKVLLIDGDLRKPDIGHMLNVLDNGGGLQNVLMGEDPGAIVCVLPSSGLHVLAANPRYLGDAYELLTSSMAAEQIERLSRQYDHLIVDSPPALAFPDALVWAKLSDAVILVGFAGQTTAPDLKEARERFARIRARVLGAVLSNVPADQGLYRHAYTYRARSPQSARKSAKPKKLLLTSHSQGDGDRTAES